MCLKLRDQQLKTIIYLYRYRYRLLYINLTVTTNQKSIIDTQKEKRNIKKKGQETKAQGQ